jgi:hypothetical protein
VDGGWWAVGVMTDEDGRRGFFLSVDLPIGRCLLCAPQSHAALLHQRSSCSLDGPRFFVRHSWFSLS